MHDGEVQRRIAAPCLFGTVFENAAHRLATTACRVSVLDLGVDTLHRRERRFRNVKRFRVFEIVREGSFEIAGLELRGAAQLPREQVRRIAIEHLRPKVSARGDGDVDRIC